MRKGKYRNRNKEKDKQIARDREIPVIVTSNSTIRFSLLLLASPDRWKHDFWTLYSLTKNLAVTLAPFKAQGFILRLPQTTGEGGREGGGEGGQEGGKAVKQVILREAEVPMRAPKAAETTTEERLR